MPPSPSSRRSPGPAERLAVGLLAPLSEPDPTRARDRIGDFRRFLLLYGAVRSWLWVGLSTRDPAFLVGAALLTTAAAALAFHPRGAGVSARVALPAVLAQVAWRFPYTANHLYLELLCLAFLALVRRPARGGDADAGLALAGLRWATACVLFHSGLQKVFYGHYFSGDFLAFMVGAEERFGRVFRWLLPAGEVERLMGLDRKRTGAGPYRVDQVLFVLASNAVWLAELALPVLLVLRRSRSLAALGGIALMVGIQAAALELGFALLFVNLLLLFLPGRWNARLLPGFAAFLLYALAAAAGWLPGHPADWNLL